MPLALRGLMGKASKRPLFVLLLGTTAWGLSTHPIGIPIGMLVLSACV